MTTYNNIRCFAINGNGLIPKTFLRSTIDAQRLADCAPGDGFQALGAAIKE
jgi:hypothetical protein